MKLVLFDIDGTLMTTGAAGSDAMRHVFAELCGIPDGFAGIEMSGKTDAAILREALRAQSLLAERKVAAAVWSVTSYGELRRDALDAERWNRLHPAEPARMPYVSRVLAPEPWPIIAASDYMKTVADQIARFVPSTFHPLGTDGFGRSDDRKLLRRFFEVDAESIAVTALAELARAGRIGSDKVTRAIADLGIDADAPNPERVGGLLRESD